MLIILILNLIQEEVQNQKFDAYGVDDAEPLFIDFSKENKS
jgi:hypothetical protein